MNAIFLDRRAPFQATGLGSVMNIHPTTSTISKPSDMKTADGRLRDLMFFDLIEHGYYMARRGLIALSLPIGQAEMDGFAAALEKFLDRNRSTWHG
jgi:glutamate-1-semialdehyde 2,1-aminomutase